LSYLPAWFPGLAEGANVLLGMIFSERLEVELLEPLTVLSFILELSLQKIVFYHDFGDAVVQLANLLVFLLQLLEQVVDKHLGRCWLVFFEGWQPTDSRAIDPYALATQTLRRNLNPQGFSIDGLDAIPLLVRSSLSEFAVLGLLLRKEFQLVRDGCFVLRLGTIPWNLFGQAEVVFGVLVACLAQSVVLI